ncbi:YdcF family protein [uncultured Corynebacterium sp.]|uniref:YdcF family protein n=1 Tax=uncultured Corynebacterium sp. TaxID=159447 RepID=UPI0025DCD318|nr:YdcF family protein [uncultured Corynebacterium sp.]
MTVWKNLGRAVGAGIRGFLYMTVGTVVVSLVIALVTAGHVWAYARQDNRTRADAILVLGAAQYNGTPSKWFAARLDHAADLYDDGVAPRIVTVGGKLDGDAYTEAEAGAMYLADKGVPASSLSTIDHGSDTLESAELFGEEAGDRGWGSVVVVTDPAHSLRATDMVRDQGITAHASPTRTGPAVSGRESQIDSILHETGGLLYYRITRNGGGDYMVQE